MTDTPDQDILKLISVIYRKTQMYLNKSMEELGLTSGLATFIMIACEKGFVTQSRFCELLDIDKSTVTKMLLKLEKLGYIERIPGRSGCRSIEIRPTREALAIYPVLKEIGVNWSLVMTRDMTGIERSIFFEMLHKAAHNAGAYFS